jgi:hypothetical protein
MIRIAISQAAFDAIVAAMQPWLGGFMKTRPTSAAKG